MPSDAAPHLSIVHALAWSTMQPEDGHAQCSCCCTSGSRVALCPQKNEDGSIDGGEHVPRPEAADEKQIEDLIQEHLVDNLEILPERELAFALHDFVEKVCFYSALKSFQSSDSPAEVLGSSWLCTERALCVRDDAFPVAIVICIGLVSTGAAIIYTDI